MSQMYDEARWNRILITSGVKPITAALWSVVFARVVQNDTFSAGPDEVKYFLPQTLHESGMLTRLEEGLNYSAERLMVVWPTRFKTLEQALPYARNGVSLANKVYGGRMGNTEPGDGFKYRGRGLLQVTGKDNYRTVGALLGLDLLSNPDLLAVPEIALRSAIAWWEGNIPDALVGDIHKVTRLVNGGNNGLAERIALLNAVEKALS